jgi:phenylacetate-coenzyme A ligase PaaK-like adenylate-forming protein
VRVAQLACEQGIDLTGARMMVGGEPVTTVRRAAIEQSGAMAIPRYGSSEGSGMGRACLSPEAPDDLHLLHERVAVIQPGAQHALPGLPAQALLITPLLSRDRLILLNASIGDQAELVQRSCGCPMEQFGWPTHLHSIRSFEKLTAGGMTFYDADIVRILEEVLPAHFGGSATDYQLLDEERPDGAPQVRLLAHPRLGPLDEAALRQTFLDALAQGSGPDALMAGIWRDGNFVRVDREAPRTTATGKIQHVHLSRLDPETEA